MLQRFKPPDDELLLDATAACCCWSYIGIPFSHPEKAQVAEQLSIRARCKDALLFKRQQQPLYGSQVLWDCSSNPLLPHCHILRQGQGQVILLPANFHC